jgi:hypothetical protein
MINLFQNIQTFVERVNIFINDITDHLRNNQWRNIFEIVLSAEDSKRLEINIQTYWIFYQYQIIMNEHYYEFCHRIVERKRWI